MIKSDLKNAILNKRMLLAAALAFICLVYAGGEVLFRESPEIDFSYIFFISMSSGSASLIALIFPMIACIPYSDNFLIEKSSGYIFYKRLKVPMSKYIFSKVISAALGGGIALSLPVGLYLLLCIGLKGTALSGSGLAYIIWQNDFYKAYPVVYCGFYILNSFICGVLFSLLGLTISAFIKNRYLTMILPLIIYIFFDILFSGIFYQLNPVLFWDINLYAGANFLLTSLLKAALIIILIAAFSFKAVKDEAE